MLTLPAREPTLVTATDHTPAAPSPPLDKAVLPIALAVLHAPESG
jgi:hypothetical protein